MDWLGQSLRLGAGVNSILYFDYTFAYTLTLRFFDTAGAPLRYFCAFCLYCNSLGVKRHFWDRMCRTFRMQTCKDPLHKHRSSADLSKSRPHRYADPTCSHQSKVGFECIAGLGRERCQRHEAPHRMNLSLRFLYLGKTPWVSWSKATYDSSASHSKARCSTKGNCN